MPLYLKLSFAWERIFTDSDWTFVGLIDTVSDGWLVTRRSSEQEGEVGGTDSRTLTSFGFRHGGYPDHSSWPSPFSFDPGLLTSQYSLVGEGPTYLVS